jgi:mono/diheme cytochrome c family protein
LKPAWTESVYRAAGDLWGDKAPPPGTSDEAYAKAFNERYGLHPAPYPNDGLPMGLRRGNGPGGTKTGLQIDCLVCHGGSIGGTSYVGLGNTTLDLTALLNELTRADGRRLPPSLFVLNSSRGTVNASTIAAVLLSLRNSDLSPRKFPLLLGTNLPEVDVPPWWNLRRKSSMYYDGRTNARSVRSNMQFLLGEKSLKELQELEPAFRDIQAYLKTLKPPKYPFSIDRSKAVRGEVVFKATCARCHGTYGPGGTYPNRIVPLKVIGTDPARARGITPRHVAHYNSTWFGDEFRAALEPEILGYQAPPLDGIWATAPYLHNGSVPTLAALLHSPDRPARFKRPPSTGFEHYDQDHVGWKFEVVRDPPSATLRLHESRFIYDTSRFGLGNGGHTFGDALGDNERSDVIEYLKTL